MYQDSMESLKNEKRLDSLNTKEFDKEALEGRILGWMPYRVRSSWASYVPSHCPHLGSCWLHRL